jgi:threonine aldolase
MIDFRSDTVTKPTKGMLSAMLHAPVGDDVFQDDPTVNKLEAYAAERFGKDAALFAPSGTMTNQIAIKVHTKPGDEVICDQLAHIYNYEGGGIAFNSGCSVRLLQGDRGRFTANMVKEALLPDDPHYPVSRLVSVENTSNKGGGVIWKAEEEHEIAAFCKSAGLAFHLDGARLFNALVVTNESEVAVGRRYDSISICLSKGLGAPVGSLLLGDHAFIKQARRVRKVFGGGMRQAGLLAAAGLYALEYQVDRLREDHDKAAELGVCLAGLPWIDHVMTVETNIVVAVLGEGVDQSTSLQKLKDSGLAAVGFGPGKIRFVTHLDISNEQMRQAFSLLRSV